MEKFVAINKNINKHKIALHLHLNRKLVSPGAPDEISSALFLTEFFFDPMPKNFNVCSTMFGLCACVWGNV